MWICFFPALVHKCGFVSFPLLSTNVDLFLSRSCPQMWICFFPALCPDTDVCIALYTQCFPSVCGKNFTGDSGGIRTHDLLLTSADVLASRPPSTEYTAWSFITSPQSLSCLQLGPLSQPLSPYPAFSLVLYHNPSVLILPSAWSFITTPQSLSCLQLGPLSQPLSPYPAFSLVLYHNPSVLILPSAWSFITTPQSLSCLQLGPLSQPLSPYPAFSLVLYHNPSVLIL